MFGFLAGVRDHTIEPISEPRGIPKDVSQEVFDELVDRFDYWESNGHSQSWLSLRELVEFDYDKNCTGEEYISESYREMLNDLFFVHLEDLKALGDLDDVRVVFWFDN